MHFFLKQFENKNANKHFYLTVKKELVLDHFDEIVSEEFPNYDDIISMDPRKDNYLISEETKKIKIFFTSL